MGVWAARNTTLQRTIFRQFFFSDHLSRTAITIIRYVRRLNHTLLHIFILFYIIIVVYCYTCDIIWLIITGNRNIDVKKGCCNREKMSESQWTAARLLQASDCRWKAIRRGLQSRQNQKQSPSEELWSIPGRPRWSFSTTIEKSIVDGFGLQETNDSRDEMRCLLYVSSLTFYVLQSW